MNRLDLLVEQRQARDFSLSDSLFLEGPASSGKTTAAIARLERILKNGCSAGILILTPQKSLANPYSDFLNNQDQFKGAYPAIMTISGLARQMVQIFWPLIAEKAGFKNPHAKPHFLSLETAQYVMGLIVNPLTEKGYFHSITIEKSRLHSQILDNLNKSALVPFPILDISNRLKRFSEVDPSISIAYDHAQECALKFRSHCLENSLLDFSLLIDTFFYHIWEDPICRSHFYSTYQTIIADNIEEDFPVSHDLLKEWISEIESSTIIYDHEGGYRSFLGADPENAYKLKECCKSSIFFHDNLVSSNSIESFRIVLGKSTRFEKSENLSKDILNCFEIENYKFYPQLIQKVCEKIASLIETNETRAEEIVILAPYLSDALRFSLSHHLSKYGIRHEVNRPSRVYIHDPLIRCLLTFAKISYRSWPFDVTRLEVRNALMACIPDLDIARADLIVQMLYSANDKKFRPFDSIQNKEMQDRITFRIGEKFTSIQVWLNAHPQSEDVPLDVFISELFGELFSRKGFKLFSDLEAARTIHKIILSIKAFRQFSTEYLNLEMQQSNVEYMKSIQNGLLPAAFYSQENKQINAVHIEPAHSFLMQNRPCEFQFWLDVGSLGWWERLNQPLTNPYLLRREASQATNWSEADEFNANQQSMNRIIQGLLRRCKKKIIICAVHINEYGNEHRGPLLQAINDLQKQLYHHGVVDRV